MIDNRIKNYLLLLMFIPNIVFASTNLSSIDLYNILIYVISTICLIVTIIIWVKHGKEDIVVDTVELSPTKDVGILESAYYVNKDITEKDADNLIDDLIENGYVTKEKRTYKELGIDQETYDLIKQKEYDGDNQVTKSFIDDIFSVKDDSYGTKDISKTIRYFDSPEVYIKVNKVSASDYTYNLINRAIPRAKARLDSKEYGLQEKDNYKYIWLVILLSVILFLCISTLISLQTSGSSNILSSLTLTFIYFVTFSIMSYIISNVAVFLIIITFLLLFGPGQYFLYLIVGLYGEPCFIPMIYGIVCLIVMTIFLFLMPKRSKQGNKVYGSAKGFKKFIDVTKKDK